MKDSCTRIVLILCSLLLLTMPLAAASDAEVGPPFKFTFEETFIPMGTVGCVDIVVEGIVDVSSFEFGLTYDSDIFTYTNVQSTQLDPTLFLVGGPLTEPDVLSVGYASFFNTFTIPDGSVAFSLCFEALTNDGDFTSLVLGDLPNGNPAQIFDLNGGFVVPDLCLVGTDVIIGDPPMALTVTTMTQASSCQNSFDGQLEINISGGMDPYSLLVTNTDTGDVIRGPEPVSNNAVLPSLNPGNYTIEITDNSVPSLVETVMVTIDNNGPSLGAQFVLAEPSCNGFMDGSIEALAIVDAVVQSNPTTDFNFVWTQTGGQGQIVGPDLINVGAGAYEVVITDIASGCSVTQMINLTEPAAVDVDIMVTNETCPIGMDGTAEAIVTGGIGVYTYVWDDVTSSTTSLVTGLGAATYTVNVRDENMCLGVASADVTAPLPPTILGFDSLSISCSGAMDGELEALFMDGSSPVDRVEWTFPNNDRVTGNRITNLGPGQYLATVIGLDNCLTSMIVSLGAPDPVMIDVTASTVAIADCPEFNDGSISVVGVGGTPPYTLIFEGTTQMVGSSSINGLTAGDYVVSLIDASSCESEEMTFTVTRAPEITAEFIDVVGVQCFGGIGGSATVVPMNGLGPYFYMWNSGETDATANSLTGGIDSLRIVSGNCFLDTTVVIPQPDEIMINADIMNVSCFGGNDGEIDLQLTGGTGIITVSANATVNGTTLVDLEADFYTIVVTDENNCEMAPTLEIAEPDSLDAFISDIQNITCSGEADGLLGTGVVGGTGNLTYQWDSGAGDIFSTNTALLAGDYIVSVTDANGCIDTAMATITEPDAIFALVPPIPDAPCFGDQTTISVVQATGGNGAPYTYTVNAGPAVPINSEIPIFAGEYTITVFDGRGCREVLEATASEPPPVQVSVGINQEINLGGSALIFGNVNSLFDVDSIFWTESPGDSTLSCYDCLNPVANPLDDSVYELFVIDENGCQGSDEIVINVDSDRNVYIPTAFTPYKVDGFNDFFSPFTGIGVSDVLSMDIYDRWGEVVFSKENFLPGSSEAGGWDGKFRGKIASKGVYFYVINVEFIDGVVLTYRGDVTVM